MLKIINQALTLLLILCLSYQYLYTAIPFFKRKFTHKKGDKNRRYAVLCCARNEENVIADLIDSINKQTYKAEIFVVADNCTDNTADIARAHGATVYERFDKNNVGKGYALNFLINSIDGEFDGYFVFDADNILEPDYIENMNDVLCDGYEVVTSYRNTKNFGDNWISASYGVFFMRESKYMNHARMALGSSCIVSGTGFAFTKKALLKLGGWNFFLLSEDMQFSIECILNNIKIGYCPDAVFYDEQPTTFMQSVRQRMRWTKGSIVVFCTYIKRLIKRITKKGGFACYDITMNTLPLIIYTPLYLFVNLIAQIGLMYNKNLTPVFLYSLRDCLLGFIGAMFVVGLLVVITEWKRIKAPTYMKILSIFSYPVFMITLLPIAIVSLFRKVEWTPIAHKGMAGSVR